jgi:hypothetical protein
MADQMTVAFIEQTGHVLGALTAVGQLGKLTPAEVAGDAMPVRFETTSMTVTTAKLFAIPATELKVEALGFHRRVFEEPRDAQVTYTTPPDKDPVLGFVSDGDHGEVVLASGADTFTVEFDTGATAADDTNFWVLFKAPPDELDVVLDGKIVKAAKASQPRAHGLKSGATYDALVLLAGFVPFVQNSLTP